FSLEETEELDTHSATRQFRIMKDWLFTSTPRKRPLSTLSSLHRITLLRGLTTLCQRINDLSNLEIQLHHKYLNLLSDEELSVKAVMYVGCFWYAFPDKTWEQLDREGLEKLIRR
ncbi:hypothetical protein T440DRAFT_362701, partial [Plenodomus tracheiphilus IPT5]